jgi:hypothetical protein
MKLRGKWETRDVWVDERKLSPKPSQDIRNHSPDGFSWGYGGSGPAQFALAVMLKFFPKEEALDLYQSFKRDIISGLPRADFETEIDLEEWHRRQKQ